MGIAIEHLTSKYIKNILLSGIILTTAESKLEGFWSWRPAWTTQQDFVSACMSGEGISLISVCGRWTWTVAQRKIWASQKCVPSQTTAQRNGWHRINTLPGLCICIFSLSSANIFPSIILWMFAIWTKQHFPYVLLHPWSCPFPLSMKSCCSVFYGFCQSLDGRKVV